MRTNYPYQQIKPRKQDHSGYYYLFTDENVKGQKIWMMIIINT